MGDQLLNNGDLRIPCDHQAKLALKLAKPQNPIAGVAGGAAAATSVSWPWWCWKMIKRGIMCLILIKALNYGLETFGGNFFGEAAAERLSKFDFKKAGDID